MTDEKTALLDAKLREFRAEGITDKDAAILYGAVADRSIFDLWRSKVELDEPEANEPWNDMFVLAAREKFQKTLLGNNKDVPAVLRATAICNMSMPFLRATFEAACPEYSFFARFVPQVPEDHAKAKRKDLPVEMRVPRRYLIEIRHARVVSGMKRAFFISIAPDGDLASVEIPTDQVFDSNHVAECIHFWDHVRRGVLPPGVKEPELPPEAQMKCEHGVGGGKICAPCDGLNSGDSGFEFSDAGAIPVSTTPPGACL